MGERRNCWIRSIIVPMNLRSKITHLVLHIFHYFYLAIFMLSVGKLMWRQKYQITWRDKHKESGSLSPPPLLLCHWGFVSFLTVEQNVISRQNPYLSLQKRRGLFFPPGMDGDSEWKHSLSRSEWWLKMRELFCLRILDHFSSAW